MPSSGVQTCALDRKSTRLNSSHTIISYAVFCLKKTALGQLAAPAGRAAAHGTARRPQSAATGTAPRRSARPPWCVSMRPLRVGPAVFFNDTATTEIYTLSLHDALPI